MSDNLELARLINNKVSDLNNLLNEACIRGIKVDITLHRVRVFNSPVEQIIVTPILFQYLETSATPGG